MILAEINQLHQLYPLQPLAMGKVLHQLPMQVRNSKLLLSSESSPSMSLNQPQGILDLRVFLVRVALVVFSRDGLTGTGTTPVKPGTGLTVAVKTLNHDGLQGHKEWLVSHPSLIFILFLESYLLCLFYFQFSYDLWIFSCFNCMPG